MFTLITLSIGVPMLAGLGYVISRNKRPQMFADINGIALQTVIVIVVLLAIAGAVAGVLISRGNQAVSDLEDVEFDLAEQYDNEIACDTAGYTWTPPVTDANGNITTAGSCGD